ncbi:MAG TPA: hypothetical protein VGQ87_01505 [Patescibacteria group bacterium]|jgi:hypothetical protein|nr:hypothetical protein [Patescibacteria group bacterium]
MAKLTSKQVEKILKKKIYKNRYLVWAIAIALITCLGLLGYIKVSEIDFERQVVYVKNETVWQTYRSTHQGFSMRFPPLWTLEAGDNTIILNGLTLDEEVIVGVNTLAAEKPIRNSLQIIKEQKITVGGTEAVKISNKPSENATETVVLAKNLGRLYVIRGMSSSFDKIVSTFKFLNSEILKR